MNGITVEAVRQRLLTEAATYKKKTEECMLDEALGRVLAETVTAPEAIPAFAKSPYDGFALPYEAGRQHFTVVATIGAGQVYDGVVAKGEAVRIMTGAPLPDGCDTIVMQERCELDGHALTVRGAITEGDNIIPSGEECEAGAVLMRAGIGIGAGQLAVAAGVGRASVTVYRRPKVLLLTSGREIIAPGTPMTKGKVYNSNLYMLKGLLQEQGLTPYATYHISDDPARLDEETTMVKRLAAEADVIISTGGVSVGLFDSMPAIYEALGAEALYGRIQMRPGAASYGGIIHRDEGNPVFCLGLSGNPTAAYNSFQLFVVPLLRTLSGYAEALRPPLRVRLGVDIHKKNPFDRYVQGVIVSEQGEAVFYPNELYTSSALLGMAKTNGLAKLLQGHTDYDKGDYVDVLPVADITL